MKTTGMIRPVDSAGRIVIPKEIRKILQIESNRDSFEIFMEGDKIVLQKYRPTCIFCENLAESVELGGYSVCVNCIEKLNTLKAETEINVE